MAVRIRADCAALSSMFTSLEVSALIYAAKELLKKGSAIIGYDFCRPLHHQPLSNQ